MILWANTESSDELSDLLVEDVAKLETWIDENRDRSFAEYLLIEDIHEQIELGSSADLKKVNQIIARFESGEPGLEEETCVRVAETLQVWHDKMAAEQLANLLAMAEKAKGEFSPITPEIVADYKKEAVAALGELDTYLKLTTEEEEAKWREYLEWEVLSSGLLSENPDLRELSRLQMKLTANEEGLEGAPFLALQTSLRQYWDRAVFAADTDGEKTYQTQLTEFIGLLKSFESDPTLEVTTGIGRKLGWFTRTGQAEKLVAQARKQLSRPNLFFRASEALLTEAVKRTDRREVDINEFVLGASITGQGMSTSNVSLNLKPNNNRAVLAVTVDTQVQSENTSVARRVVVYSSGKTSITGEQEVFLTKEGLHSKELTASAKTKSIVTGISAPRLMYRAVKGQVDYKKPKTEYLLAQRAADRLKGEVASELAPKLAEANQNFVSNFQAPLVRRGQFPEKLQFRTTEERLYAIWLQANSFQLGAPGLPEKLPAGKSDLVVQLHESYVVNLLESLLGGVTLTDEELVQMLTDAKQEIPEELEITQEKNPWEITFAANQPVGVQFDNQAIQFSLKGTRFKDGRRVIREEILITAGYNVEKTEEGTTLTREGEVEVFFPKVERLDAAQVAIKTAIQKKFSSLFKDEIQSKGIRLPEKWNSDASLQSNFMNIQNGWFSGSWILEE